MRVTLHRRRLANRLAFCLSASLCFAWLGGITSFAQTADSVSPAGPALKCDAEPKTIKPGDPVHIGADSNAEGLIYAFGSSEGSLSVARNQATLDTSSVDSKTLVITVVCSALTPDGHTIQATDRVSIPSAAASVAAPALAAAALKAPKVPMTLSAQVAPTVSWTTGTQTQTISGGTAMISGIRSKSYCDASMKEFGITANASDTTTTKSTGVSTYLDNNDLKANYTQGTGTTQTKSYIGASADFFGNNSLGLGLQQTYTAQFQFYLTKCSDTVEPSAKGRPKNSRVFASVGVGAGFMSQRLYVTSEKLNAAVLPLSAQFSYLQGNAPGLPPKLIWYGLLGYLPVLTDTHAYQVSAVAGVQIPTPIRWLTFNISDSDLYMNNAPVGFKRNYQNGTVALVFSLPRPAPKVPNPLTPPSAVGACYGGDKLARLYCYDDVTADACAPPNLFRPKQVCSSSGVGPHITAAPEIAIPPLKPNE